MQLAAFLAAMVRPLAAKLLLALGFQVVTITGVVVAVDQVKALILSYAGQVPAAGFQMALLGGFGEALGVILGAIAMRITLWQIQNGTKFLGVG